MPADPNSTSVAGTKASTTVSFSRSSAHIPRVIRRTTDPAKLLACQSVANRCTRQNASCTTARIIRVVTWMIPRNARCRPAICVAPSAAIARIAAIPAARPATRSALPTASISRPANSGYRQVRGGRDQDGADGGRDHARLAPPMEEGIAENGLKRPSGRMCHDWCDRRCRPADPLGRRARRRYGEIRGEGRDGRRRLRLRFGTVADS